MLSGLAFTDEKETKKELKRRHKKSSSSRHHKSSVSSKRPRRADDVTDDDGAGGRLNADREASRTTTEKDSQRSQQPVGEPSGVFHDEKQRPGEEDDFFSAALASKESGRGDRARGKEAKRLEEEARVAKIVASRELNPEMRSDVGASTSATVAPPPSVVGDGGASWRLKALRRAQERAAAEGRNVNDVVSEHWGSVNDLVAGIGDGAAHSKAHLYARRERENGGGSRRDDRRRTEHDGARPRMQVPSSYNHRNSDKTRLGEADRELITTALSAQDGGESQPRASMNNEPQQQQQQQKHQERVSEERLMPAVDRRTSPLGRRAVPEARDVAMKSSSTNMSAAAALKARLLGSKVPQAKDVTATEVLPMVTSDGRAAPGAFGRDTTIKGGAHVAEGMVRKAPKTTQRFEEGSRSRYYADDDGKSLRDLVAEQKYGGVEDYDRNLADNISRHKRYRGKELDVDDEYDHDGGLEMYENREKKMSGAKQQARAKEKAIRDVRRMQTVHTKCPYCMDAPDKPKHLHVAYGNLAYLMLPPQGRLVPGHCIIAPISHAQSSRQVDEDAWEEIRNFKKCLVRMFAQEGKDCCFIETATKLGGFGAKHAIVECIPIPQELSSKAPLYFKKAIDEAESEWSTHDAKKCLSTAPPKGLRGTIPENFPYFHVEFNMKGGFVHVIDDETKWRHNFGRSILIGLMNLPENLTDARQRPLAPDLLRLEMDAFLKLYDPMDWTKQLE